MDQAHRGYSAATQKDGYASLNPLFMKYTPSNGKFVGQDGYGYRSIERFIDAALSINQGHTNVIYRETQQVTYRRCVIDHTMLIFPGVSLSGQCKVIDSPTVSVRCHTHYCH